MTKPPDLAVPRAPGAPSAGRGTYFAKPYGDYPAGAVGR